MLFELSTGDDNESVIWVEATKKQLLLAVEGIEDVNVTQVVLLEHTDVDFFLPQDAQKLRDHLQYMKSAADNPIAAECILAVRSGKITCEDMIRALADRAIDAELKLQIAEHLLDVQRAVVEKPEDSQLH